MLSQASSDLTTDVTTDAMEIAPVRHVSPRTNRARTDQKQARKSPDANLLRRLTAAGVAKQISSLMESYVSREHLMSSTYLW